MVRNQKGFPKTGQFYKGNLHCHSTNSDGTETPEERIAEYREAGYDFLAITDHWYYTDMPEKSDETFLLLPGTELDCSPYGEEALGYHIVGIGRPGENKFPCGRIPSDPAYRAHDLIAMLENNGNFAFVAHPYWLQLCSEAYCRLDGVVGLEVFNSLCQFDFGTGFSEHIADEAIYKGKRPLLFATDDYHWAAFRQVPDHFMGYVMVKAEALSHEAIVDALLKGHFYASYQGPQIHNFEIRDGKAIVETSPCRQICLRSPRTFGSTKCSYSDELTYAEFPLEGHEKVVRAVVMDQYGHTSWTQLLPVIAE